MLIHNTACVLQISELRVSLRQIIKQDHKIHNMDDKFTITYSGMNTIKFFIKFLKTKLLFHYFLFVKKFILHTHMQ
jgi:20S proteasome alpha/beta subunit